MTSPENEPPALISAKDADLGDLIPSALLEKYEIHSYRNAARILAGACPNEFMELLAALGKFKIATDSMVRGGGNKSAIAYEVDDLLNPLGWFETRIKGHMLVETTTMALNPLYGSKKSAKKIKPDIRQYMIKNMIDGHKIDFVKGRVAFDMEWNSKDQTFDRDLYAMRAFYEAGIINVGVLLTRDTTLKDMFAEIGKRVAIKDFKSKYGASTTWMGKLTYRLDAGRAGGCPILAIGIKPSVVEDFESWKEAHPIIRKEVDLGDVTEHTDPASDED